MLTNYPTSSGGFIYDAYANSGYSKSSLFSTPMNDLEEYTFFMCLYLGSDISSSISQNTSPLAKFNPLISGITTFSGSLGSLESAAAIMYQADFTLDQNLENGNQQIQLGDNNSPGLNVPISLADQPSPFEKHILTVSVSGSGAVKIRKNGTQIYTTGSSILSGSKYTFNTIGSTHVQFEDVPPFGYHVAPNTYNLSGVIFGSAMVDSWMTDTDIYAMEQVIATRNGLSI
jgi:hypothetical protein